MQRARILRLTGLAGTAVLALVVPLAAATAGPADTVLPPGDPDARDTPHAPRAPRAADAGAIADPLRGLTLPLPLLSDADGKAGSSGGDGDDRAAGGTGRTGRLVHCGAELTAQQGITAQTCLLTEDGRTWARTYYRNSTGDPLRAALTLLSPDGRSIQADCAVPADRAPGVCETPGGPTAGGPRLPYGAVAEFSDAAGERLLLRASGNWAPSGGSSGR